MTPFSRLERWEANPFKTHIAVPVDWVYTTPLPREVHCEESTFARSFFYRTVPGTEGTRLYREIRGTHYLSQNYSGTEVKLSCVSPESRATKLRSTSLTSPAGRRPVIALMYFY